MVHFSVCLMNRHNKTESGIFAPCMKSFLLKDLLFQNLFSGKVLIVNSIDFLLLPVSRQGQFKQFGSLSTDTC